MDVVHTGMIKWWGKYAFEGPSRFCEAVIAVGPLMQGS
jgi:hypothetical protein